MKRATLEDFLGECKGEKAKGRRFATDFNHCVNFHSFQNKIIMIKTI